MYDYLYLSHPNICQAATSTVQDIIVLPATCSIRHSHSLCFRLQHLPTETQPGWPQQQGVPQVHMGMQGHPDTMSPNMQGVPPPHPQGFPTHPPSNQPSPSAAPGAMYQAAQSPTPQQPPPEPPPKPPGPPKGRKPKCKDITLYYLACRVQSMAFPR